MIGPENAGVDTLADLLSRCAGRDIDSFAALYDLTHARVYGTALRVLWDAGLAEDTTQEVYLQVWRNSASFDPAKGSALTWLMTLAHRRAVDRVRSEQSNSGREIVYGARNHAAHFDDVYEEVSIRSEYRAVNHCLDALTVTQRESVALAYYRGLTYSEVASQLGVALPTAKSRIRDGLIRLRRCMGS